ncbi:hypothetical protein E2C01_047712 [Portunus trituberculatus]|uniref:Uncharacterized protein n=1 Tax=Portunus trituberculatus TaxID=210409 RepID=A0A5B7G1T9_PORTR|nr:hypothetical protein [Portunus trituberculatus]
MKLDGFGVVFPSIPQYYPTVEKSKKSCCGAIGIGISENVEIPQEQVFPSAEWRVEVTTSQYHVEYS